MSKIQFTGEQLDQEVLFFLRQHVGQANPMDRWELVRRIFGDGADQPQNDSNSYDRRIRDSVERLRSEFLICDSFDGRGRYLASSYNEYMEFRQRYTRHAYPIMRKAETMDDIARKQFPKEYEETRRNQQQPRLFTMEGS